MSEATSGVGSEGGTTPGLGSNTPPALFFGCFFCSFSELFFWKVLGAILEPFWISKLMKNGLKHVLIFRWILGWFFGKVFLHDFLRFFNEKSIH